MKKRKFYHAFYLSFFSRSLYRDVASVWRGIGFTYLFILQAICLVFIIFKLNFFLSEFIETKASEFFKQIPAITIDNGTAYTEENRPYFIFAPDDKNKTLLAVIDTTGEYTSLKEAESIVLVTQDEIIIEDSKYETRSFSFQAFDDLDIDNQAINDFLQLVKQYFAIAIFPFALIGLYLSRIIQVLIYGVIGVIIAQIAQIQLNYAIALRLASVAITPVLLLEAILSVIVSSLPPTWGFIGLLLVLYYLYFAVKANAGNSIRK